MLDKYTQNITNERHIKNEQCINSETKGSAATERLLVAQAKAGDGSAFGALYERHRARVYSTAFRILRNQQDAEDVVQKSFVRAFTRLVQFREDSTFTTWLTRIAINEALMLTRQKRPTTPIADDNHGDGDAPSFFDIPDARPTPEQALARMELRTAMNDAISKLRHNLRIVVLLREVQGLTSAETARALGLTVSAVKARTFHAKRYLRRHFKRNFDGAGFAAWQVP
jgi:RNA polymerase sigma-70 factor, ECF subfamily